MRRPEEFIFQRCTLWEITEIKNFDPRIFTIRHLLSVGRCIAQ